MILGPREARNKASLYDYSARFLRHIYDHSIHSVLCGCRLVLKMSI